MVLHKVVIADTMFAIHHHTFFQAEDVFVNLAFFKLIKKQSFVNGFRIEKGYFYLFTDTSGYSNNYLFNPKKDPSAGTKSSKEKNELRSIILKDVHLVIDDKLKQKFHDVEIQNFKIDVDDKDSLETLFSAKAEMLVHSLAFNVTAGSFIKEKSFTGDFKLRINKKLNQLQFDSIDVEIGGHPFNATGRFDLVSPEPQFSLRLHTRKFYIPLLKRCLPKKFLQHYQL